MKQIYCYIKSDNTNVKATEEYYQLQTFSYHAFYENFVVHDPVNAEETFTNKMLLDEINSQIENGDILSVSSLTDLGDTYAKIIHEMKYYNGKGTGVISKGMATFNKRNIYKLDDISPILKMNEIMIDTLNDMLHAYIKRKDEQNRKFRETIHNKGIKLGRPKTELPAGFEHLYRQWKESKITTQDIISNLKISRSTLYRYAAHYEKQNGNIPDNKGKIQEKSE